VGTIDKATFAH